MKGFLLYISKSPVNKYLFFALKISFSENVLFLSPVLSGGVIILTSSYFAMGSSVRIGLPKESSSL